MEERTLVALDRPVPTSGGEFGCLDVNANYRCRPPLQSSLCRRCCLLGSVSFLQAEYLVIVVFSRCVLRLRPATIMPNLPRATALFDTEITIGLVINQQLDVHT